MKEMTDNELYHKFIERYPFKDTPDHTAICLEVVKRGLWNKFIKQEKQDWAEWGARSDSQNDDLLRKENNIEL